LKRLTLAVGRPDAGERLDRFIAARGGISRGEARRALEQGGVFLDGHRCKIAGRSVYPGQQIVVNLAEGGRSAARPAPLDRARLLYADEHLAAVDKPAGVPAQPTLTSDVGTLPDLVAALLGSPVTLVHRLDRETSGVTVLARTREAAAALAEAFRTGGPEKTYLALCARAPIPTEGRVDAPLGKDPARAGLRRVDPRGDAAATAYRTLRAAAPSSGAGAALVEARPETGRTHQIRVHLAHLGAPLLGDARYGGPRRVGEVAVPRVMLHARRLVLAHPVTGERLVLEAEAPADFAAVERALIPPPIPTEGS
jgi:23S rRNA pseudouridine1911/1915/1917 synthase